MHRSGQHSRVQAGLASFLHALRWLRRKSSRKVIRKLSSADHDLTSLRQRSCTSFPQLCASIIRSHCRLVAVFSREAGGASIFQSQIRVASIFSPHGILCVDVFLLDCQLLLSGSQELDGHHLAE
ncbi:hypothetical protein NDU88_005051 [Pleurodeles waltl]|uniref:Uncharacterized protein n=1 Tax=Pleurodeles waltl TaxID=8319 RepID=A0AAV7MV89_PLEWA|nr:hypothetical protein NDU88_005051 [Pleurodeles waltl]